MENKGVACVRGSRSTSTNFLRMLLDLWSNGLTLFRNYSFTLILFEHPTPDPRVIWYSVINGVADECGKTQCPVGGSFIIFKTR